VDNRASPARGWATLPVGAPGTGGAGSDASGPGMPGLARRGRRVGLAGVARREAEAAASTASSRRHSSQPARWSLTPDAPAVDVHVNDDRVLSGVGYKTVSDYLELPAESYDLAVRPAGAAVLATAGLAAGGLRRRRAGD
jgi:Domain of unknown function (DUF4397)